MTDKMLTDRVALVTGAASSVANAIARRLLRSGAAVARVEHRVDLRSDGAVAEPAGGTAHVTTDDAVADGATIVIAADLTDPDAAASAVEATLNRFGRLDILVNGTNLRLPGTALHAAIEEWDQMVALNLSATLHVTHAAVPYLIDAASTSGWRLADIVNLGYGIDLNELGTSVYHLTRSGIDGFTDSLRGELALERVRVSLVQGSLGVPARTDHLGGVERVVADLVPAGTRRSLHDAVADAIADAVAYVVAQPLGIAVCRIYVQADQHSL